MNLSWHPPVFCLKEQAARLLQKMFSGTLYNQMLDLCQGETKLLSNVTNKLKQLPEILTELWVGII